MYLPTRNKPLGSENKGVVMNKILVAGVVLTALSIGSHAETPKSIAHESVDSFERLFGVSKGKRRNHTKGFCFTATLSPVNPEIKRYSKSMLFKKESSVIGRLSHKGGNNNAADNKPGQYGMALSISTADSQTHQMSMNTLDFFPVSTPEAFLELMKAKHLGKDALRLFKKKYPEIKEFKAHMAKKDKSLKPYEDIRFNSVNSFYLVDEKGIKTAFRWSFIPNSNHGINVDTTHDFFFQNIKQSLKSGSVSWNMQVTLANPSDVVDDAAKLWLGKHKEITAARLILSSVASEKNGQCEQINFDPLILSSGIEPSKDPILHARSQVYAVGFGRRVSEKSKL